MGSGASIQRLPDKSLAEKELNVFLGPLASGKCLQEHHDFLKVHLQQLIGPFNQKCGADIQVELGEALLFSLE